MILGVSPESLRSSPVHLQPLVSLLHLTSRDLICRAPTQI